MSNQQYFGNAPSGPPQGRPQGHQPVPNEWETQHHEFDNPSPQPQHQQFQNPSPQPQHQQFQNPSPQPQQFQNPPPQDPNPFHAHPPQGPPHFQNTPPGPQHHPPGQAPHHPHPNAPSGYRPPARTDSEALLPTGEERSEQVETLQNYEMARPQSYDDRAQEELQREFPNMDSSLIAAIWSDNRDMGAAREMLQHLSST